MDGKGQGAKRDPFLYNPRTSRIGISMGGKVSLFYPSTLDKLYAAIQSMSADISLLRWVRCRLC